MTTDDDSRSSRAGARWTRRGVLGGGALFGISAVGGCSFFSTEPATKGGKDTSGKGVRQGEYAQAPMFSGDEWKDLPPLSERLPEDPMVVQPTDRIGRYGGAWNTTLTDAGDGPWLHRTVGYEPFLRWNREFTKPILNVVEKFEPNEDTSEYTLRLRKGMRWSDGHPLTTEDILFAYQHVVSNRDLQAAQPPEWMYQDEPATIEAVDDYEFVVRFAGPKPLFPRAMARQVNGNRLLWHPKHYLKQFHIEFNPNADKQAKATGEFDDWIARFNFLGNLWSAQWQNPDLPTVNAWVVTNPIQKGSETVFRRNPYYFKVDPEGNQLPYIDRVHYEMIPENQTKLLHARNGDYDFHSRHIVSLDNRPVLAESKEQGDYRLLKLESTYSTDMAIALNLNHANDALREVFQDKRFRVALSHAIDRQELIDAVWQRTGRPSQCAPRETSKYYDKEFAQQYLEYDPGRANQILDDAGYDQRDGQGWRLRSDGERISIVVDIATPTLVPFWVDGMGLVKRHWEDVGIKTTLNPIPREDWEGHLDQNNFDATVWAGEGGFGDVTHAVHWYMAAGPAGGAYWARQWSNWYATRGNPDEKMVEKRPEPVRRQHELYDQFITEPDDRKREQTFRQILEIAKEQFWAIGTVQAPAGYAIVANDLKNVGGPMPEASAYNTPAPANPEQWFFAS